MKHASKKYQNIRNLLAGLLALFTSATATAQEYKYEIGGAAGAAMYLGDANPTNLLRGLNPGLDVVFRSNTNFRWAVKTGLMWGKISGDTKNTENVFLNREEYRFSRNFFDLGSQMEFNFLPYSDKYPYLSTSRIAPYVLSGLGFTVATGKQTFLGLYFSLGLGVKYKIKNRINVGVEYAVRRLFKDAFDSPDSEGFNLDNPYKIKSGIFKNKDGYNTLMFSVTWDFAPNNRKCTNE
ncbi:MAG: porin family protein [Dysgonamonadaceae bacterium]|jgi:opacity protein-like surface antigen|nr:porin family protein [Dysgonamonadaceae bacterium]